MSIGFLDTPRGLEGQEALPSIEEVVRLGAHDYKVFSHGFFPKTVRQPFPRFSDRLWNALDSSAVRQLNAQMFRGSSKTTTLRLFSARRISYATSRTIVFVSAEARHAERNLVWLKSKIETPTLWSQTFGLRKGAKWNESELHIIHSGYETQISVLALGILGGIRGINVDDWRPDLIIVDDVITDQVAMSETQLDKIEDLLLGALVNSLAPEVDTPGSKIAMLQTPFREEDVTMKALRDPAWVSIQQGCWTKETAEMDLEHQESVWPERFPSESLRQRKLDHIRRNKSSLWAREMEVKLVTKENTSFDPSWLEYYSSVEVSGMHIILAIDPVPPPSEREIKAGYQGKDYECHAVVGFKSGRYYLLEYCFNRGHNPNWTLATLFGLISRWRPRRIRVESIQYQRTLSWIIRQEMQRQNRFVFVEECSDKREKTSRIIDALNGVASQGAFLVKRDEHSEFINQFCVHPNGEHDDILDAVSLAVDGLSGLSDDGINDAEWLEDDEEYGTLVYRQGSP